MSKYKILINNKPYCGDDFEPGKGDTIYYENKKDAKNDVNCIYDNWSLTKDDIVTIVKIDN